MQKNHFEDLISHLPMEYCFFLTFMYKQNRRPVIQRRREGREIKPAYCNATCKNKLSF